MEQPHFFINGKTFHADDARLQDALARVYDTPERPRCLCVAGGVEMYVAKHGYYVIKRMPADRSPAPPELPVLCAGMG